MTPKELKDILKQAEVPCAYYQFKEDTKQQPPFICYFFNGSQDLYADDINYARIERLYVELYTDRKDFALESKLERILNDNGMAFVKEEDNIDSEHMHVTVYTTNINLEVENA